MIKPLLFKAVLLMRDKMKLNLGVFGIKQVDINDDFYQKYPLNLSGYNNLTALSIALDVFEQEKTILSLAHYLDHHYLTTLDQQARTYFISSNHLAIDQYITTHFNEIAHELWHYHHIQQGDTQNFLVKLMLICIHIKLMDQHIIIQFDYSIDPMLSDEVLRVEFNPDGCIHHISYLE